MLCTVFPCCAMQLFTNLPAWQVLSNVMAKLPACEAIQLQQVSQ